MFDTERKRILELVGSIYNFAITTVLWAKHAYTGLTIHYIMEEDFSLQSHLLATKEFPDSHTAENISEEMQAILGEWNLSQDELSAVTTDNGSNIVLATEILGWPRMPCFSHSLCSKQCPYLMYQEPLHVADVWFPISTILQSQPTC